MSFKGLVPSLSLSKSQNRQSPNPIIDCADLPIPSPIGQIPKFPNPPILQSHHRFVRSPDPSIPPIPQSPDPPIIDRPDPFEKMYYNEPEDLLELSWELLKSGGAAVAGFQIAQDPPQPLSPRKPRLHRWLKETQTPPEEDDTQLVWFSQNYLSSYTITHLTEVNQSPVQALHHIIKNQEAHALLAKKLAFLSSRLNPDPAAPPPDPSTFWKEYSAITK